MKTKIVIHRLIPRVFDIVRVNQVLIMPFLMFLLLVIIIFLPIASLNPFVMVAIVALKSVFLSGWLNMFHMCLENLNNDSLTDEQKTLNSFNLYKEFFPGVGKYFQKIFWGILIFILFINLTESALFHFLGNFSSFKIETLPDTLKTKSDILAFWAKISHADKIKIYKIAGTDVLLVSLFSYLTMFWMQSVIVDDNSPVKAFVSSMKTIFADPLNTFLIFSFTLICFLAVFVLNYFLGENILGQLLTLMLFAYAIVYNTMLNFLYFERYR